jgi:curved DNA-binding protein CbpA
MNAPQPTAAGTLAATPMQHLLVYALERRLGGSIVLETPQGERSAFEVEAGVPTKAKTSHPVIHLGRVLLEMGAISETTLRDTLARVAKEKILHGRLLLAEHAIDEPTLNDALREQLARKIQWMATLPPQTVYGFYEGASFLSRWGAEPTPVEPLALIWRAIRSYESPQRIEATLARLPRQKLRLHPEAQPARFRFSQRDQIVLDLLRAKPQSLRELLDSEVADEASVKRVLYALAVTRHLELGADTKPIGICGVLRAQPPPAPQRKARATTGARRQSRGHEAAEAAAAAAAAAEQAPASPEIAGLRQELVERARQIPGEDYYQILGVARDAAPAAIQAAFFKLAKRWHPDRLPVELVDVRELVMRTFARMSEASQVLSDSQRRAEYDQLLAQGGGSSEEQEQVQTVMRALINHQKAQVWLKKRNLAEAEEHAKRAVDDDPTQADYLALYAWILSQKPERADGKLEDLIKMLDQAASKEPANERVRFYRAQLLKRAGRTSEAMREFRWIVEHDPRNLEAAREIRLFEMRKSQTNEGSSSASKPVGRLFGKLFKR